jgi:hypothetical protein
MNEQKLDTFVAALGVGIDVPQIFGARCVGVVEPRVSP